MSAGIDDRWTSRAESWAAHNRPAKRGGLARGSHGGPWAECAVAVLRLDLA